MRVRKSKAASIDDVQLAETHGVVLHPDLHLALLHEFEEMERKGKLCRLPATILETYNVTMPERVALFEESCRRRNIVLEYYLNLNR